MSKLKSLEELFAGRHFDREVIIFYVRRYLRYKLSLRDLVEMMAERGLQLAHTMILRWVRRYAPEFRSVSPNKSLIPVRYPVIKREKGVRLW
jgi:transposase-like protein